LIVAKVVTPSEACFSLQIKPLAQDLARFGANQSERKVGSRNANR
jgi:hypothetical protein